jgi:hypothetical protein
LSKSSPFQEIVGRILDGKAPVNLRAAAARGALPLPRPTIARLQVHLLDDPDQEIRQAARAQLDQLDSESIQGVLTDRAIPGEVLVHFAERAAREEALAEQVAFHPSTPVEALVVLASSGGGAVIDLVLTNEERLLVEPDLLECLMNNPAVRTDQRGRILELLDRVAKLRARQVASDRAAEEAKHAGAEIDLEDLEEVARLLEVDVGELLSASEILGAEELEESDDPEIRGAYKKILSLNTAQKAILAMKGGREERLILVRDSNRTVALAVLKNGRITDTEVESIAKMRNINNEVLRQIGGAREWTKNYTVVTSLIHNPRTPQGVSTNFVNRLSNHDLKNVASNRDVPELIRRMAKRTLDIRTKPKGVKFKRK